MITVWCSVSWKKCFQWFQRRFRDTVCVICEIGIPVDSWFPCFAVCHLVDAIWNNVWRDLEEKERNVEGIYPWKCRPSYAPSLEAVTAELTVHHSSPIFILFAGKRDIWYLRWKIRQVSNNPFDREHVVSTQCFQPKKDFQYPGSHYTDWQ